MKSKYYNILFSLPVIALAVSCADDPFDRNGSNRLPDNMIRFDVTSGMDLLTYSRSGQPDINDCDLSPISLTDGKDTLYIHRYVGREDERATGVGVASRGAQVTTANFISICHDFLVQASYTTGGKETYIQQATAVPAPGDDNGDVWYIRDPRYYWPEQKPLLFNAFAPVSAFASAVGLNLGAETITFSYTVPVSDTEPRRDAELQPDIMLASTTCNRSDNGGYAPLNFRHALAAIKFAVRDVAGGEIIDISLKGVAGSGNCIFNPDAEAAPAFSWTDLGDNVAEYTQAFNYKTIASDNVPGPDDIVVINDDIEGMNDKTFMLIPQSIPDDAELIITFKPDGADTPKKLKGKLKSEEIPAWEAGKEYIYTISTSSEVWAYVFDVTGSIQAENDVEPRAGAFSDDNDNIIINATVTEGSYYNVTSYRYRKNNPNIKEPLAWSAVSSNGTNIGSELYQDFINQYQSDIPMSVPATDWFPGKVFNDDNVSFGDVPPASDPARKTRYDLTFRTQYVATNWEGDWVMRAKDEAGTKEEPIDLSISNRGNSLRNTANCYVVNRAGWYTFPLVYGNAIVDGGTNSDSYTFYGPKLPSSSKTHEPLNHFTDYNGAKISSPYITGADHAKLVWQDAYGIIDHIELTGNYVKFHIARRDLQQSNSVIAVCDDNDVIMWSWHIWVNEDMVDDNQTLVGGIMCETWREDEAAYGPFELAIRNLGWCDPKNVSYLERTGKFTFTQQGGKNVTKELNIKQRGKKIEFWIGNNTYYQWGRKDPMVGFRYCDSNNDDLVKYNFGDLPYGYMNYSSTKIKDAIRNPNLLLAGTNKEDNDDWTTDHYYNLWNNYYNNEDILLKNASGVVQYEGGIDVTSTPLPTRKYSYSGVKTIYDPSPAGFMVPPQSFFELLTKGQNENKFVNDVPLWGKANISQVFNGNREQKNTYYQYNAYPNRAGTGDPVILLTATGQRWHRDGHSLFKLGGNMNPGHVYLWCNSASFYKDQALTFIVGNEQNLFISTNRMLCRKTLARPIRPVREK